MNDMRKDAHAIINESLRKVLPDEAVREAISTFKIEGRVFVLSIGKAAWTMAKAVYDDQTIEIHKGIVITKHHHLQGGIPGFMLYEAGHPVADEDSLVATKQALLMLKEMEQGDQLIFLISGGGSSLFELPEVGISLEQIADITRQLLSSGADIGEINTIRKRLSAVKGGKLASYCQGAKIYAVVLSDVIGDRLDVIASGPVYPDKSTSKEATAIIEKYSIRISDQIAEYLLKETPKNIENCETIIAGGVNIFCQEAAEIARNLGYTPFILTSQLECEAREAGKVIAVMAKDIKQGVSSLKPPCAIILGGETVVKIRGNGIGGRNQEIALSAAINIEGAGGIVIFSVGSDGTDGPTGAAGGIVDGDTVLRLKQLNESAEDYLDNNDSYHALLKSADLLITGPTGTNVNDISVALIR